MEIISINKQKARKKHKCNYCNGSIKVGELYERQFLKYDDVYIWKSHIKCKEIASKLEMFDNSIDGLTSEDFKDCIREEFMNIWHKKDLAYYESKDFVIPKFSEQLDFVINKH